MCRLSPLGAKSDKLPLPAALLCSIRVLNGVLERSATRCAEAHGLTMPQWMALGCVGNGGSEGITHSELGQRLMLSKAPITGVVDRLAREGFVLRIADDKDRRVSHVTITPLGEAAWHRVSHALRQCASEQCAGLSEDEQHTALELLERLLDRAASADPTLAAIHGRRDGTE